MAELTPEQVTEIAKQFNVAEDEVRAHWGALNEGGPEAARGHLRSMVATIEQKLAALVASAHPYIDSGEARDLSIVRFYGDALDELREEGVDVQALDPVELVMDVAIAAYKLAEGQQREAALLDGSRRMGEGTDDDESLGQER